MQRSDSDPAASFLIKLPKYNILTDGVFQLLVASALYDIASSHGFVRSEGYAPLHKEVRSLALRGIQVKVGLFVVISQTVIKLYDL